MGPAAMKKWSKFLDDFDVVLVIQKALTSIFRLKNFYFFLGLRKLRPSES